MTSWPTNAADLIRLQDAIAREAPPPWRFDAAARAGGCAVVFAGSISGRPERGEAESKGDALDVGHAAAVLLSAGVAVESAVRSAAVAAPFAPGLLALREGPLLDAAVRALGALPDVLLVHAAGRDHPRRAGLALHLGWALGVPTVGVTERPLLARGAPPPQERGAATPLDLDGERVGYLVRTRAGALPVAAHAAWRTTPEVAAEVVRALASRARTPEPVREALRLAREARRADGAEQR